MKQRLIFLLIGWYLLVLSASVNADLFIVVNSENALTALTEQQVERIFMLKARRFENGNSTEPVNQSEGSKAREVFNAKLLKRSEQQLKYYWSRKMFSGGDQPPPVAASDADVENFVAERAGGIGYLLTAPKNERVKVVLTVKH